MSTIPTTTVENFKEKFKQKLASLVTEKCECANCIEREKRDNGIFETNIEKYPELSALNPETHYEVLERITLTELALADHFSSMIMQNPLEGLMQQILSGEGLPEGVKIMSAEDFNKMQSEEAPIIPLGSKDGQTHC